MLDILLKFLFVAVIVALGLYLILHRRKDRNDSYEPYIPESANEARAVNDALSKF